MDPDVRISAAHPLLPELLTVNGNATKTERPADACGRMHLTGRQRRLCRQDSGLAETLLEAVRLSATFCRHQFRYERWDCPIDDDFGRIQLLRKGEALHSSWKKKHRSRYPLFLSEPATSRLQLHLQDQSEKLWARAFMDSLPVMSVGLERFWIDGWNSIDFFGRSVAKTFKFLRWLVKWFGIGGRPRVLLTLRLLKGNKELDWTMPFSDLINLPSQVPVWWDMEQSQLITCHIRLDLVTPLKKSYFEFLTHLHQVSLRKNLSLKPVYFCV